MHGTKINFVLKEFGVDTSAVTSYTIATNSFTIKINRDNALNPEMNRLLIAKTIFHEMFHVILQAHVLSLYNSNNLEWLTATLGNNADPLTKELLIYYQNYHGQRSTWNPTGHEWLANHLDYVAGLLKQYVADYYPVEYAANQYGDKPFFAMLYQGLEGVSCMDDEMATRGIIIEDIGILLRELSTSNCPQ